MRKQLAGIIILGLVLASAPYRATAAEADGPMLVHGVYFTLKDNSADARQKLLDACKKYLTKHPGTVHFAVGSLAEDLKGKANDRDFDIALYIVFKNKEAQGKYQVSERHQQFIKEVKDNLKKVRVFDSVVEK